MARRVCSVCLCSYEDGQEHEFALCVRYLVQRVESIQRIAEDVKEKLLVLQERLGKRKPGGG